MLIAVKGLAGNRAEYFLLAQVLVVRRRTDCDAAGPEEMFDLLHGWPDMMVKKMLDGLDKIKCIERPAQTPRFRYVVQADQVCMGTNHLGGLFQIGACVINSRRLAVFDKTLEQKSGATAIIANDGIPGREAQCFPQNPVTELISEISLRPGAVIFPDRGNQFIGPFERRDGLR